MRETPSPGTIAPDDFRRIRDVFERALEQPVIARRAFVEHVCAGNTLLVAEVNRMLEADARFSMCSSCQSTLGADDRFCRACGTPTHGSGSDEGRFRAGALFANRFRIVAPRARRHGRGISR